MTETLEQCVLPVWRKMQEKFPISSPSLSWAAEFARRLLAELSKGQEPVSRTYPCGCVLCICDGDERCYGCGAKSCGKSDAECDWKQERIKAVRAIAQEPVAQDGYVMVPRKRLQAWHHQSANTPGLIWNALASDMSAMLAASPSPTTPDQDAVEARRYRWLRSVSTYAGDVLPIGFWEKLGDEVDDAFDARIDAAMRGEDV